MRKPIYEYKCLGTLPEGFANFPNTLNCTDRFENADCFILNLPVNLNGELSWRQSIFFVSMWALDRFPALKAMNSLKKKT